jgi:hypothetical protein
VDFSGFAAAAAMISACNKNNRSTAFIPEIDANEHVGCGRSEAQRYQLLLMGEEEGCGGGGATRPIT